MKHKHHEQKDVHHTPDESHPHHDAAGRMRHNESKAKARGDERKGEKKGVEHRKSLRKAYEKAVKTSKPGEGKRSKAMGSVVEAEYIAKGKSPAEAKRISGAIIGKVGRKAYGAKKMGQWSARGRK